MAIPSWLTTFALSPAARRELESKTHFWLAQTWLRVFVVVFSAASCIGIWSNYLARSTTGVSLEGLIWAFVWSLANLVNILGLHTPMSAGINFAMDIIAGAGLTFYVKIIVNLPFVRIPSHQKDKAGHGALSAMVILATVPQLCLVVLDCLVCHGLRKQRVRRAKMMPAGDPVLMT